MAKKELTELQKLGYQKLKESGHYERITKKGGNATLAKHGKEHLSRAGKIGGSKPRIKKEDNDAI